MIAKKDLSNMILEADQFKLNIYRKNNHYHHNLPIRKPKKQKEGKKIR